MASKVDLIRAGNEGFSLVEEYTTKKRPADPKTKRVCPYQELPAAPKTTIVCSYPYQAQKSHVCYVKPTENIMITYEVVQFPGGEAVMDYSQRKYAAVAF